MNIFDWMVVATKILAMVSWPIVLMRPSWLAIKKTWASRSSSPIFLILSIAHAGFSTSATVYFYMKEFYWEASHVNSPGIVDVLLWIGIPLFVLMLSLPLYLLLKYFAVKYEAWDTQHS